MSIEQTADQFFQAIERGDVAELNRLFADDAAIWHNFTGTSQSKTDCIETLARFAGAAESKYVVDARYVAGDVVCQRHHIHVRMRADGQQRIVPVAIFVTIRDGKVTHIHEYLDSAHVVQEALEHAAA